MTKLFKEYLKNGRQKPEMPAKQNKAGDIPAHDKHSDCDTNDTCAQCIYIAKIFRRQVK